MRNGPLWTIDSVHRHQTMLFPSPMIIDLVIKRKLDWPIIPLRLQWTLKSQLEDLDYAVIHVSSPPLGSVKSKLENVILLCFISARILSIKRYVVCKFWDGFYSHIRASAGHHHHHHHHERSTCDDKLHWRW